MFEFAKKTDTVHNQTNPHQDREKTSNELTRCVAFQVAVKEPRGETKRRQHGYGNEYDMKRLK